MILFIYFINKTDEQQVPIYTSIILCTYYTIYTSLYHIKLLYYFILISTILSYIVIIYSGNQHCLLHRIVIIHIIIDRIEHDNVSYIFRVPTKHRNIILCSSKYRSAAIIIIHDSYK